MSINPEELKKIADLAYLEMTPEMALELQNEVGQIMDFVELLRQAPTANITPLFHPLAHQQPMRPDQSRTANHVQELEDLAPLFDEGLYLVPQVIE